MSVVNEKSYLPDYISYTQSGGKLEQSVDYIKADVLLSSSLTIDYSQKLEGKTPLIGKSEKHTPAKVSWFGIFLAFLSGVVFTFCSGTIKYLANADPMELLVFRAIFQVVLITLPIALLKRKNIIGPKGSRLLLLFQGIIGATSLVLLFYSYRLLPLGDAATIIFSSPVFVMVMSHVWLREPCGFYRLLIVMILIAGVSLVTQPPFLFPRNVEDDEDNVIGYIAALSGTVFMAAHIVVMRKCKEIHFSIVVFYSSFCAFVVGTAILLLSGDYEMPNLTVKEWLLCLLVPVLGASGQILVAVALRHEGAGRVAVTRSLDIVLAYVLQVTIFGEVPSLLSVAGAGMVIICVVGMGLEDVIHHFLGTICSSSSHDILN